MKVGSIPQITMLIQNEKMVEQVLGNPKRYAWHFILHFTSSWYNATLLITSTAITRQNFQLNKNFSFTIHISDPSSRVFFHLPDVYTFKHSLFCEDLLVVNTLNFIWKRYLFYSHYWKPDSGTYFRFTGLSQYFENTISLPFSFHYLLLMPSCCFFAWGFVFLYLEVSSIFSISLMFCSFIIIFYLWCTAHLVSVDLWFINDGKFSATIS